MQKIQIEVDHETQVYFENECLENGHSFKEFLKILIENYIQKKDLLNEKNACKDKEEKKKYGNQGRKKENISGKRKKETEESFSQSEGS